MKDSVAEKTLIQVSKDLYVYIQKHIYIFFGLMFLIQNYKFYVCIIDLIFAMPDCLFNNVLI